MRCAAFDEAAQIVLSESKSFSNSRSVQPRAFASRMYGVVLVALHRAAHTSRVGVLPSFCFAAAFSAFSWYAMRHGALLGGTDST